MTARAMGDAATLVDGEVAIWAVALDGGAFEGSSGSLSDAERARAARFRSPVVRDRFIAAHGALRAILARYRGAAPSALVFTRTCAWCGDGVHGKPRLVDAGGLEFSLTRAGGLALVAVTRVAGVGIDAVPADRAIDWGTVAHHALAPRERAALEAAAPARRALLTADLWCRKEAVGKAVGLGLALDPRSWTAERTGTGPWLMARPVAVPDPVLVLDVGEVAGARAAVAVTGATAPPTVTWNRIASLPPHDERT